jgi:hypothetical protein
MTKNASIILFIMLFAGIHFGVGSQIPPDAFVGRIAWSADGNDNDEDDWSASPMALNIFAAYGLKHKLVHFHYNSILVSTRKDWEKINSKGVLTGARLNGYDMSRFFNVQENKEAVINDIARIVNESTADDPLFFMIAGPMDIPFMGLEKSNPENRKHVYCISHSYWNDGLNEDAENYSQYSKRNLIDLGINWIQIKGQNQFTNTTNLEAGEILLPPEERHKDSESNLNPWYWLRDSKDPSLRHIWDMFQLELRPDCSDAGMAYFLASGDENATIAKIRQAIEFKRPNAPIQCRTYVRIEAENFQVLNNFNLDVINEREASQRNSVLFSGSSSGDISTNFNEIKLKKNNRYDVEIRYFSGKNPDTDYAFYINGIQQGPNWKVIDQEKWQSQIIKGVMVAIGDKIQVKINSKKGSGVKLDFVELVDPKQINPFTATIFGELDDPDALPGQIVVVDKTFNNPGYLRYNGFGPAFLCGPDNPETFLFMGELLPDGTRDGIEQEKALKKLGESGANAFHLQLTRMKKCNYKDEGDDTHSPFIDFDPSKGLNPKILDQWDDWIEQFAAYGITLHFELYNDATDVSMMGWTLDKEGNLHPDEYKFIKGVVERFRHHKNIIWGLEESANKLPRSETSRFKKIAALISETDNYNHPIVQSFVVPNDPEGDFHPYSGTPDDYAGDPNIDIVTWLHVVPNGEDFEKQYQEYKQFYDMDASHFIVWKNESYQMAREGYPSRSYMWSAAMAGLHCLEAYHHAHDGKVETLEEDGFLAKFMEATEYYKMIPRNDLAVSEATWVLANPGQSYIVYSYDCQGAVDLQQIPAGTYSVKWMDSDTGEMVELMRQNMEGGDEKLNKPPTLGKEVAIYLNKY